MGRPWRAALGGMAYHVLNRANAKLRIFDTAGDFAAFERILVEANERYRMRICAYSVMPNHWHFVLWPRKDDDLSRFVAWLTLTHTQRWHAHRDSAGTGHLYQGRFKSFPVQDDEHFLTVCRYVERNPLRAGLVRQAEEWRWGSLWRWKFGSHEQAALLSDCPVQRPRQWLAWVNKPQTEGELAAIRKSIQRGAPLGDECWVQRAVKRLGLESTLRQRGRPGQKRCQEPFPVL